VANARQLSPAFDAECRAADRPVGFWQRAGFAFGWLRGRWPALLFLAGAGWLFVLIAPFLGLIVKGLAFLVPLWLLTRLFGSRQSRGYYTRGGAYRIR